MKKTTGFYPRLSVDTTGRADQDPTRQIDEIRAAGWEKVWTDHGVSGMKATRPELDAMLE